ncbi:IS701 family transposase [Streptomyces hygroscopicus]|nr:transposase [Streptomyces hygroscopicus]
MSTAAMITRDALSDFAGEIFSSMSRVDQRRWGEVYLRGLLVVEGKKSVRRISEDVLSIPAHQSLQQFINQSPWEWEPVRAHMARYVSKEETPKAWVLSRVAIPKRGERSVGVERRFLPEASRTVNCQIGLAVALAVPSGNLPVNWRLLMPAKWLTDSTLRESAYIPRDVRANPEWVDFVAMLDELEFQWDVCRVPVVADLRHLAEVPELVTELTDRGLDFSFEVDGSLEVLDTAGQRRPVRTVHAARGAFKGAGSALESLGRWCRQTSASCGHRDTMKVVSSLVTLPDNGRRPDGGQGLRVRLLTEVSPSGLAKHSWITNLREHRVDEIVALSRLAQRSKENMKAMENRFGLRDFEGRSYRGWHHHMTMVSAAYAFHRLADRALPTPPG